VAGGQWQYLVAKHFSPLIPATSNKSQEPKASGWFNGSSVEEQEFVKIGIKRLQGWPIKVVARTNRGESAVAVTRYSRRSNRLFESSLRQVRVLKYKFIAQVTDHPQVQVRLYHVRCESFRSYAEG
jgi:hypothetical protein